MRFPTLYSVALVLSLVFGSSLMAHNQKDDVEELLEKHRNSGQLNLFTLWEDIGTRAGFEIGNGRKVIRNQAGAYLLKIYKEWEVGILGKFTEIISPLYEGVPRARLQINVLHEDKLKTVEDLLDSMPSEEWMPVVLGELEGVQKRRPTVNGVQTTEVRLFRGPGEVIVMALDGKPGDNELTAYDKVQHALTSFKSINIEN